MRSQECANKGDDGLKIASENGSQQGSFSEQVAPQDRIHHAACQHVAPNLEVVLAETIATEEEYKQKLDDYNESVTQHENTVLTTYINSRISFVIADCADSIQASKLYRRANCANLYYLKYFKEFKHSLPVNLEFRKSSKAEFESSKKYKVRERYETHSKHFKEPK